MSVYDEVQTERERQDARWGGAEHDDQHTVGDWIGFVRKQLMDIARAGVDGPRDPGIRKGFIQIAALCVAAVESLDRKWAKR